MKKFLSLTLAIMMTMSLLVVNASAAYTLGNFNDFLTASEKCLGTETSYQWMESSSNSDIYGDVTVNKFPVGTYIALKDTYSYYMEVLSQTASLKPGEAGTWIFMTDEFTIKDDHTIWALRIHSYKTDSVKLVFVQGTPGTKAAEHTGSIADGTVELPRIFSDVPNDAWYQPAVVYCYQANIMNGVSATEFAPNRELTRAMVWVMMARLEGVKNIGGSTWYEGARQWVMKNGLSDGTMPNNSVTNQQLATMMYRYWQYKKLVDFDFNAIQEFYGIELRVPTFEEYTDTSSISSYAVDAMKWAIKSGVIDGVQGLKLNPTAVANRAQVAYFMAAFHGIWAPSL